MALIKAAPQTPKQRRGARGNNSIAGRTSLIANSAANRKQAHRIVGRDRLSWRTDVGGCFSLHFGRRTPALIHVVPDGEWPHMFRVRSADGTLSDMVNLTRAKDAARAAALRDLNFDPQETTVGARPFGKMGRLRLSP